VTLDEASDAILELQTKVATFSNQEIVQVLERIRLRLLEPSVNFYAEEDQQSNEGES
jgi:hypothetical protein